MQCVSGDLVTTICGWSQIETSTRNRKEQRFSQDVVPSCISQAHHGQDPKHAATRHLQICAKHLAGFCWSLPVKTNLKVLLRLQEVHKNKATFPSPLTLTKPRLHHHFYLYNKSLQQQQEGLPVLMNARANGKMKPRKLLENDIFQPSVDITICHPASVPGLEMNEEAKTFLWIFFPQFISKLYKYSAFSNPKLEAEGLN